VLGTTKLIRAERVNYGHLSDEQLELYCLDRLPTPTTARAEEHLLQCVRCQQRCEETQIYLETLRRVLVEHALGG